MTYIRRYYGGRLALDVQHDLRTEMFGSIARLDGRRQDELSTGQVVGRATSDLQLIQGLLFMLPMTIGNLLLFVISLVIMASLSLPLTAIALAVAPALWWIAKRSRTRLHPPPGTPRRRRAPSPGWSTARSAASAWSRASARRSRRPASSARSAAGCSPDACAPSS